MAYPVPASASQVIRGQAATPLSRSLRGPMLVGVTLIGLFGGGLGTWAVLAPLASAAIAPGVVSPQGSRRTVQHLEGGIIESILIEEGSVVQAGDPLLVLADTQVRSDRDILVNRRIALAAEQARLVAERNDADAVQFPDWLLQRTRDPIVVEAMVRQTDQFNVRAAALSGRRSILEQRTAQLATQIAGSKRQIASQQRQLELIGAEIDDVETLLAQGLAQRPRLLALQRSQAQIEGVRAELEAEVARAQQAIGETELEILALTADRREEVTLQLNRVQEELSSLEEKLRASEDVLTRTEILAPVSGTVVELRFHTVGGVIGAGQPILDIVPRDEELVVEARVSPLDIDTVHEGLRAQVVLSAFKQRNLPRIEGQVRTLSADRLIDQATGQAYFLARVAVDRDTLQSIGQGLELTPGMPAEVFIMTGERTAFDYFIGPLLESLSRSFRET
jgi:HlyD family secretion protein/epimerase transport system membrane fusion protein